MRRYQVVLTALFFIIIGLQLLRIYVISTLDLKGQDYQKMNDETEQLRKQNVILKDEYLEMTAYTTISKKARAMGYIDAKQLDLR